MNASHALSKDAPTARTPTESEIREQLARIRSSSAFDAPERAKRFLTYVVEEALHGRADRIKAYSIAIEVFGRDATFDAQNDPVVRIEAGRVRRALEHYYLQAGQKDPIRFTVPKGGYVPVFSRRDEFSADGLKKASAATWAKFNRVLLFAGIGVLLFAIVTWNTLDKRSPNLTATTGMGDVVTGTPEMPEIIVPPFEALTGDPNSVRLAGGLTDEVIGQMARFKEIVVIAAKSSSAHKEANSNATLPIYRLEGRVRLEDAHLRLSVRLTNDADQALVWTRSYDRSVHDRDFLDVEHELAAEIAGALAQPYGVVFQTHALQLPESPAGNASSFACTLTYYGYHAGLGQRTEASVQSCLKKVVAQYPNHATAWALLSLTYADDLRFRARDKENGVSQIDLAVTAARRAVEIDPENVRALQAEMVTSFLGGDVKSALAIGDKALAINPNDMEFAGEYAVRLALSGQWERGCAMITDTLRENPGPLQYLQSAMALCTYRGRNYEAAEQWARAAKLSGAPFYHLTLVAIYGQLGWREEAQAERALLVAHAPRFLENLRNEVAARILAAEDQEHFIAGLRLAGLDPPPTRASDVQVNPYPAALK